LPRELILDEATGTVVSASGGDHDHDRDRD
jgi:hypothetical protein